MQKLFLLTTAALAVGAVALPASAATMKQSGHHQYQRMSDNRMMTMEHRNVPTNSFGRLHAGMRQQPANDPVKDDSETQPRDPHASLVPGSGADF